MIKNRHNVVIDTNVLVSSVLFGGKPREIVQLVQENNITAFTTPILVAELLEILVKKFQFSQIKIELLQELIQESFILVYPSERIKVIRDEDDNRVLEAAVKGACEYIITGDKDLLDIKKFENILIVTPNEFLSIIQN